MRLLFLSVSVSFGQTGPRWAYRSLVFLVFVFAQVSTTRSDNYGEPSRFLSLFLLGFTGWIYPLSSLLYCLFAWDHRLVVAIRRIYGFCLLTDCNSSPLELECVGGPDRAPNHSQRERRNLMIAHTQSRYRDRDESQKFPGFSHQCVRA